MSNTIDLEKHISITASAEIEKICRPLRARYGIHFFRYLKLYKNGKRVVFSNIPDAIRYMYGQGEYVNLWYDGNFPAFLKPGWHAWHMNRLLDSRAIEEKIENELIDLLKVDHGLTFIQENPDYYEVFSFDAPTKSIYQVDRALLLRFIYYFKAEAMKLIHAGERDTLWFPIQQAPTIQENTELLTIFLKDTSIRRYYLNGKYGDSYLTSKEFVCIRWMILGKSMEEIALIEGMQTKTVQRHIENIKLKFNCSKQTQLVKLMLDAGLHEMMDA